MPRRPASESCSDHVSDGAQASERPRKRGKQMEHSSSMVDTQEFVAGVTKLVDKVTSSKDDPYIADFEGKVETQKKAYKASIDKKLKARSKAFESRRRAATQVIALVPQPGKACSSPSSAQVPSYLLEAVSATSDMRESCRNAVELYKKIIQVISDQAVHLPARDDWQEEFYEKQQVLKTGVKATQDGIDRVLGRDYETDGQRPFGKGVIVDLTTIEDQHVEEWMKIGVAKDSAGEDDEEMTLVEPDVTVDESFQQTTARIAKYTRRMMKNVDEVY